MPVKSLEDIAGLADANRDKLFKVSLKQYVRLVRIEPGRLDVNLTGDAPKTLLGELTTKLKAWTGRQWIVSLSREEGGQTLAETESAKRDSAIMDAKSDPAVAAIPDGSGTAFHRALRAVGFQDHGRAFHADG